MYNLVNIWIRCIQLHIIVAIWKDSDPLVVLVSGQGLIANKISRKAASVYV